MDIPIENNVVYKHLIRQGEHLSEGRLHLIGCLTGVGSSVLSIAFLFLIEAYMLSLLPFVLLIIAELSLIIMIPSVAGIMTSQFAGKFSSEDELALLRLTNISSQEMADGYIAASRHRLSWLWIIGLALVPQAILVLAYFLGALLVIVDCFGPCGPMVIGNITLGILPALILGGLFAFVAGKFFQLAIYTGVWLGFRWKEKAPEIAGAFVIMFWVVVAPLIIAQFVNLMAWGDIVSLLICLSTPLIFLLLLLPLTRFVRSRARRALEA